MSIPAGSAKLEKIRVEGDWRREGCIWIDKYLKNYWSKALVTCKSM